VGLQPAAPEPKGETDMKFAPRYAFRHVGVLAPIVTMTVLAFGVATAQAQTKIVHGTVFLSSTDWAEFVADAKGFFKQEGLEVETIATRSSAKAIQQLAGGSVQLASSGMPDHLRGIEQGAPTKMFLNQIGTPPYTIYGKASIKSVKDLKGKTVIIGGPKDITRHYVETLFKKDGLEPGSYDYIYAGSTSNRFAALQSGGVDAAILLPPFTFKAKQLGFTDLGNVQTVLSDFPFTVYSYNTDWAKTHRKELVGFTAALMKGKEWLYDLKNRKEAAEILSKAAKFSMEDSLANYDFFIKDTKAIARNGAVSETSYKQTMDVLIGWGDMKAPVPPYSHFYDASVLADANKLLKK
jgi:NitT/TauT family transport system substrate-binding protein